MEALTSAHLLGAALTMALMLGLGVYSGRKVKNASDFDTGGGSAGPVMVAGTIIGTLVGGSSTIGTAQLAFGWGLSAWWFTLGGALGCLALALGFAGPLRRSGAGTIQQLLEREFGPVAGVATSLLATLGLGLNIVSQLLSANVLLGAMFGFPPLLCTAVSVLCMACYVVFGGVNGTGLLGVVKSALLYAAVLAGGFLALTLGGGAGAFWGALPHGQYFNLFARGVGKDLGAGVSVILGVLSTQTYVQAVLAGKTDAAARGGALLSALLIPPIGAGSILVGYYMRRFFPAISPGDAFPAFILHSMPPLLGGAVLGTLFIAVVGTGSGLALGLSTVVTKNLYQRLRRDAGPRETLRFSRCAILGALLLAALFTWGNLGSAILAWGFLSMGLRAVVLLAPLLAALYFPGRVDRRFATASSILGILVMMLGEICSLPGDSLFWGMGTSVLTVALGALLPARLKKTAVKRR